MKCEVSRVKCECPTGMDRLPELRQDTRRWKIIPFFTVLCLLLAASGCANGDRFVSRRSFDFQTDTFSYANELVWEYHFDQNGKWVHQRSEPEPDYTHHCFVVARSARQFFQQ